MTQPITTTQAVRATLDAEYMKKTVESPNYSETTPDGVEKRTITGMNQDIDNLVISFTGEVNSNIETINEFVTSEDDTLVDQYGNTIYTLNGMLSTFEDEGSSAIDTFNNNGQVAITSFNSSSSESITNAIESVLQSIDGVVEEGVNQDFGFITQPVTQIIDYGSLS